jgi:hypothetical protein
MRKSLVLATAAAMAIGAGVASADSNVDYNGFHVTSTRTPGSGALQGFDVIIWRAINDNEGPTAGTTNLKVVKAIMDIDASSLNANGFFKLFFEDQDGDGVADGVVDGKSASLNYTTPAGSFVRLGTSGNWTTVLVQPNAGSDTDGDGTPNRTPNTLPEFTTNLKQIRVEAFTSPAAGVPALGPTGVAFAAAVVPGNNQIAVRMSGSLAASAGGTVDINQVDPVPEPAALGFIGLSMFGRMSRRRKQA